MPESLGYAGKHLWHAVTETFELGPGELAILREACHTRDAIADLQRDVNKRGVTEAASFNEVAAPRAVIREIRQQRLVFVKLMGQLKISDDAALGSSEPRNTRHRPRQRDLRAVEGA